MAKEPQPPSTGTVPSDSAGASPKRERDPFAPLRAQIRTCAEDAFAVICEEVTKRRGAGRDLSSRILELFENLSDAELNQWFQKQIARGEPQLVNRLLAAMEAARQNVDEKEIIINIVPYTVADTSLAEIVRECPDPVFEALWNDGLLYRAQVRGLHEFELRLLSLLGDVRKKIADGG